MRFRSTSIECGFPIPRYSALALNFCGRDVVENKVNAALAAFIHHTMFLLVINLVNVTDRHLLRSAVNHKSDSGIGRDWYVNSMTTMKRWMFIPMLNDFFPANNFAAIALITVPPGW